MTTLTLQPDGASSNDGSISFLNPTFNYGAGPGVMKLLSVSGKTADAQRPILRFDLSSLVGIGAVVSAFALTLYCNQITTGGGMASHLYRITQLGVLEGTGNGTASADGATWNTYDGVNAWVATGGDFTTVNGVAFTAPTGIGTFVIPSDANMIAIAQDAIDNRAGKLIVILKIDGDIGASPNDGVRFDTGESATPAQRPKIDVTYSTAPPALAVPTQVLGGKGPLLRPDYDHLAALRSGHTGDTLRAVRELRESIERTTRQLVEA